MALTRAVTAVARLDAARGFVTYSCDPFWSCFTSSEEEEGCFNGRLESSCCKASQLIRRMMEVDMDGDIIADPSHMRDLCLQLLQFPRASDEVEAQLTNCSHRFIGKTMLSGVVLTSAELGDNRSCSKARMHARYPMHLTDFAWLQLDRWHSAYFKHFQAPVASTLESLADHTLLCTLGTR